MTPFGTENSRPLGESVEEVHVVVNTCCAGTAQRAAAILRDELDPTGAEGSIVTESTVGRSV